MNEERTRLGDLRARLLALHAALLAGQRRDYEEQHGATTAAALLRLVIDHEDFAWLRTLSAVIARIDEALDAEEADGDIESFFRETQRLLRSGGSGAFDTKYHEALQRSPEVVMAHADVMKVLRRRSGRGASQSGQGGDVNSS